MSRILESLANLIFPKLCLACRAHPPVREEHLCKLCFEHLPFISLSENAQAALEGKTHFPQDIDKYLSLFYYTKESYVAEMIHHIKYDGMYKTARYLGGLLYDRHIKTVDLSGFILVPVPLHPKKLRKRGYNQAEEIAKGISIKSGVSIETKILVRLSDQSSQTKKDQADRSKVLENAFAINPMYNGDYDKIILIDDVVTTGATIAACYKALTQLNIQKLYVATLGTSI